MCVTDQQRRRGARLYVYILSNLNIYRNENKQEPNFLISIEFELLSSYISACDLRSTKESSDALVFRVNVLDILVVVPIFAIDVSVT